MEIRYTEEVPHSAQIYALYDIFGWNDYLQLSEQQLHQAMVQSWCVVSAYDQNVLVGTGRIVSDGILNAYLCGLAVHSDYQHQGIGSEIVKQLVRKGRDQNLHLELFCEDEMVDYYEKHSFKVFAVGMKNRG